MGVPGEEPGPEAGRAGQRRAVTILKPGFCFGNRVSGFANQKPGVETRHRVSIIMGASMHPLPTIVAVLVFSTPIAAQPVMPKFSYRYPVSGDRYELIVLGPGDLPEMAGPGEGQTEAALRAKYGTQRPVPDGEHDRPDLDDR